MNTPILRCIWCCKDTETNPCQHCQSEHVYDRTQPHKPMWSRKTMRTVECKICDREIPAGEQGQPGDECRPIRQTCGNCKHSAYPFAGKHVRCVNPKVEIHGREELRLKSQSCELWESKKTRNATP